MNKILLKNLVIFFGLLFIFIKPCSAWVGINVGFGPVYAYPEPFYSYPAYPVVYPEPYPPELGWIPGHWECNYWVPGHFVQLWREPMPTYVMMGGCYHCHHHHHHCG